MQANAEPDMKQTGDRLKHLIDNLVEDTLQLVADPFADDQVITDYRCGCTCEVHDHL